MLKKILKRMKDKREAKKQAAGQEPPPEQAQDQNQDQEKQQGGPMDSSQLSDITRGLYHAASTTTAMVAQQYIHILQQFFDQMDDGTLQAKMAKVAVDDQHFIMVPLISLVSPMGFNLERMKVGLAVRVDAVDVRPGTHPSDDSEVTRTAFTVSMSPRPGQSGDSGDRNGDAMTIDLEFVSHAPPEGVMRIIDNYTNLIRPAKLDDGSFPPIKPITLKDVARVEREGEGEEPMPGDEEEAAEQAGKKPEPPPRRPEDGPGNVPAHV